ncbi:MAG: helix-hairpin-helix domain-containing protein [Thiovulaceae bacterium]|jgi:competence protein ComEA|nr:helix-hairpin-helix domain-containing protein [Sulfurimonadaceae bacterium]
MKKYALLLICSGLLFGAVDINTANQNELETLKGVSAKKAQAIIAYREKSCFKNINELMNVSGIGEKTFAKNKENLKASGCQKK